MVCIHFLLYKKKRNKIFFAGTCNAISNTTFSCSCAHGWEGIHCETQINYCRNVTCENNGVCRPLFLNYICECLGNSYSGRHCEIKSRKTNILQIIAKSLAYVAIIIMISAAIFIIVMDILKYWFGIDLTFAELAKFRETRSIKKTKRKVKRKTKPPVVVRYTYVN